MNPDARPPQRSRPGRERSPDRSPPGPAPARGEVRTGSEGGPPHALSLTGLIERVTFFNEENGFCVLKVKVRGQRDLVTVVGSLAAVSPGEYLHAEGHWVQDREFGRQFQAAVLTSTAPTTPEGIERYLGSGMVKGVGPVCAQKLVARFGAQVFEVIEHTSARLEEVDGIGPKRRRRIKEAWAEQKVIREIMVFLHSHGVSTSRAVRIHKTYGAEAIEKVRSNPYQLARDIVGIGFVTADGIARKLGVPADSLARAAAGLSHALLEATNQGHCALPVEDLLAAAGELLGLERERIATALARALDAGELIRETVAGEELVYLPHLRRAEEEVAARVRALTAAPAPYPPIDFEKALVWCQGKTGKELAPSQRDALRQALTRRCLVLTGGPGVGKTTLLQSILRILRAKEVRCLLCAPTGRAAKRLSEATGLPAVTIHRLLQLRPGEGSLLLKEGTPLECDLLVVDESSMVDVVLMHHLLRALPAHAALLLVGDVDQLPSVGPGLVLRDLIECGRVPVVRLTEVFRQAATSRIITNAHRINQGLFPELPDREILSDFYFLERTDPPGIAQTLLELVQTRLPARFGLDPIQDIQVLCPMNRGVLGVRELNARLQAALNPPREDRPAIERFGTRFQVGDKVLQTENNYDKEVFNGDIGQVVGLDAVEQELRVRFEGREVSYDFGELDELVLAYAITVHKAQGSEFPAVVMPLAMSHFLLLQRNLLYTGVTRGRRLVVLVGQKKALAVAVRHQPTQRRCSGLRPRLEAP